MSDFVNPYEGGFRGLDAGLRYLQGERDRKEKARQFDAKEKQWWADYERLSRKDANEHTATMRGHDVTAEGNQLEADTRKVESENLLKGTQDTNAKALEGTKYKTDGDVAVALANNRASVIKAEADAKKTGADTAKLEWETEQSKAKSKLGVAQNVANSMAVDIDKFGGRDKALDDPKFQMRLETVASGNPMAREVVARNHNLVPESIRFQLDPKDPTKFVVTGTSTVNGQRTLGTVQNGTVADGATDAPIRIPTSIVLDSIMAGPVLLGGRDAEHVALIGAKKGDPLPTMETMDALYKQTKQEQAAAQTGVPAAPTPRSTNSGNIIQDANNGLRNLIDQGVDYVNGGPEARAQAALDATPIERQNFNSAPSAPAPAPAVNQALLAQSLGGDTQDIIRAGNGLGLDRQVAQAGADKQASRITNPLAAMEEDSKIAGGVEAAKASRAQRGIDTYIASNLRDVVNVGNRNLSPNEDVEFYRAAGKNPEEITKYIRDDLAATMSNLESRKLLEQALGPQDQWTEEDFQIAADIIVQDRRNGDVSSLGIGALSDTDRFGTLSRNAVLRYQNGARGINRHGFEDNGEASLGVQAGTAGFRAATNFLF